VSLRASSLLLFPINKKVVSIVTGRLSGLPMIVLAGWSNQINLVIALALHQERMPRPNPYPQCALASQKLFALKLGMNGCRHGIIRDRGGCGFHMSNEQGQIGFTTISQMPFVSH
jgi:hypothetical protein